MADEAAFEKWVETNHPTELVTAVNPTFRRRVLAMVKEHGGYIDADGVFHTPVPGVERGDPCVTTRTSVDPGRLPAAAKARVAHIIDNVLDGQGEDR